MTSNSKYLVRQYRPAYFSGFKDDKYAGIPYDEILSLPFFANFKQPNFVNFVIAPYDGDELIISAKYSNGESWVAGFALPEDPEERLYDGELLRDNWRCKEPLP